MPQSSFDILKQTCHDACRERHACTSGYRQMLASENVSQMMATWRANWEDIVTSKYADIIRTELPKQYPALRTEMNAAGIYFNECPLNAPIYVRVLIASPTSPVHIYGDARAYILSPVPSSEVVPRSQSVCASTTVIAHDHAQVYHYPSSAAPCALPPVSVTLLDHAYAHLLPTDLVTLSRFATVTTTPVTPVPDGSPSGNPSSFIPNP